MKTKVKYRVDVDPEIKKEMERLADHLAVKLEGATCLDSCTLVVQEGWIPISDRNFYSKSGKVSVTPECSNVIYNRQYLHLMLHEVALSCERSSGTLRERLKDRYPEMHREYKPKRRSK